MQVVALEARAAVRQGERASSEELDAPHAPSGASRASLDRSSLNQGERLVFGVACVVASEALCGEPSLAALRNAQHELLDLAGGGGSDAVKVQAAGARVSREQPIEDQRVEVDVEVERRAEALHHGDRAGLALRSSRLAAVESLDLTEQDPRESSDEVVVSRELPLPSPGHASSSSVGIRLLWRLRARRSWAGSVLAGWRAWLLSTDGIWLTTDDDIQQMRRQTFEPHGSPLRKLLCTSSGTDQIWVTADDTLVCCEQVTYDDLGHRAERAVFMGEGTDRGWFTADDSLGGFWDYDTTR